MQKSTHILASSCELVSAMVAFSGDVGDPLCAVRGRSRSHPPPLCNVAQGEAERLLVPVVADLPNPAHPPNGVAAAGHKQNADLPDHELWVQCRSHRFQAHTWSPGEVPKTQPRQIRGGRSNQGASYVFSVCVLGSVFAIERQ